MGEAGQSTTAEGQRLDQAVEGRADVGRTVATRLRKGTLTVLVELAADVARWPARAVEFRTRLEVTQSVNHVRLDRGRTADLRRGDLLEDVDGPFDGLAHVAEIARASSARRPGRYALPDVGLFVWRLGCYSVTQAPAFCWDQSRNQYSFSILGNDAPLLTSPPDLGRLTEPAEVDVPPWIRRRWFEANLDDYYGPQASLCIWRDQPGGAPIPVTDIVPADLTGWTYRARPGQVAVDPVLGRIAFPPGSAPTEGVWVSYHYGFSADTGGGEYERARPAIAGRPVYTVGPGGHDATIMAAVGRWRADKAADATAQDAVIEVLDSGVYAEAIDIALDEGDHLELRAAPGTHPVILLLDRYANRPDAMRVYGTGQPNGTAAAGPASQAAEPPLPQVDPVTGCVDYPHPPMPAFVLDGFLVTGRSLLVTGPVARVTIRHCTLVPGWSLECDCTARRGEEPSIELTGTPARLVLDHAITGSILVTEDEPASDPIQIDAHDSIIDATSTTLPAISGPDGGYAYTAGRTKIVWQVLTSPWPQDVQFPENVQEFYNPNDQNPNGLWSSVQQDLGFEPPHRDADGTGHRAAAVPRRMHPVARLRLPGSGEPALPGRDPPGRHSHGHAPRDRPAPRRAHLHVVPRQRVGDPAHHLDQRQPGVGHHPRPGPEAQRRRRQLRGDRRRRLRLAGATRAQPPARRAAAPGHRGGIR
jgi:hypothetical protein